MVAIKDMEEMPSACTSTQEILGDIVVGDCPLYNICKHRDTIRTNYKPSDCPLVEVEERKVGKWIYKKLGVRTFGIVCSSCNRVYHEGQNIGSLEEFKKDIERIMRERNITLDEYCCHCGAEMESEE